MKLSVLDLHYYRSGRAWSLFLFIVPTFEASDGFFVLGVFSQDKIRLFNEQFKKKILSPTLKGI